MIFCTELHDIPNLNDSLIIFISERYHLLILWFEVAEIFRIWVSYEPVYNDARQVIEVIEMFPFSLQFWIE